MRALGFVAAAALLVGCAEQRAPTFKVSGVVTHQGKPLRTGTVAFHNADRTAPMARGEIGPDGTYTLTTYKPGDGAPAGECKVTVSSMTVPAPNGPDEVSTAQPKSLIPLKYLVLSQTPLTATVRQEDNVIPLTLSP